MGIQNRLLDNSNRIISLFGFAHRDSPCTDIGIISCVFKTDCIHIWERVDHNTRANYSIVLSFSVEME